MINELVLTAEPTKDGVFKQTGNSTTGAALVEFPSGYVNTETSGTDATSNTQTNLTVTSRLKGFNGSTWDRIRSGVKALSTTITGYLNTLPTAFYHASPTTRTEAQAGYLEADAKGNLQVNLPNAIYGENENLNVMQVAGKYSYNYLATAATTVIKSGAGVFGFLVVQGGTTGTITIYDNTAGSGTIIAAFDTTNAIAQYRFEVAFTTGLTVVASANTKFTIGWL